MPKVLIVDDSSFQRRLIRRALGPLAEDTIEAGDGMAAFELLQHEAPGVILLDLLMPKLDGFGYSRSCRKYSAEFRELSLLLTFRIRQPNAAGTSGRSMSSISRQTKQSCGASWNGRWPAVRWIRENFGR